MTSLRAALRALDVRAPNGCHVWSPPGERRQTCSACGASCKRDKSGRLVEYTHSSARGAVAAVAP